MKIKNNFIRSSNGEWHNMNEIRSFYIGGGDDIGYRICFNYEYGSESLLSHKIRFAVGTHTVGDTRKTIEECQEQLDVLMDMYDYTTKP